MRIKEILQATERIFPNGTINAKLIAARNKVQNITCELDILGETAGQLPHVRYRDLADLRAKLDAFELRCRALELKKVTQTLEEFILDASGKTVKENADCHRARITEKLIRPTNFGMSHNEEYIVIHDGCYERKAGYVSGSDYDYVKPNMFEELSLVLLTEGLSVVDEPY